MFTRSAHRPSNFFSAVALLTGTTIGAGIFALPYVVSQAGLVIGLVYIIGLGLVSIFVNLAYGEIVLSTARLHQFPGYVEKYLNPRWKKLALISLFIGLYGAITAYLLEVGHLLTVLLQPSLGGEPWLYTTVYFLLMAAANALGLRAIAPLEKVLGIGVLMLIGILVVAGFGQLQPAYWLTVTSGKIFLPYGVVLFALAAASAIPDMARILTHRRQQLQRAIMVGTVVPIAVYIIFVMMVVGITGPNTTTSAVVGLGTALGSLALLFGGVFGCFSMSTSFMSLGLVLREVWQIDYHWPTWLSWLIVMLPPYVMVSFGWLSFIQLLGITGALIGGVDGIIIMRMHRQVRKNRERTPEYQLNQTPWVHALIYLIFFGGIVYELYVVSQQLS
ncbi:MAG: amino acid permease [Candidatus Kerfeldbacteria bacterium]|nr:amino acid permease [Candidatus Kerfeldbacteria bacterium]